MKNRGAQRSFLEGDERLVVTKPVRLIELFAGIGSQYQALKNIGIEVEHWRAVEFDKYAVASYNAIHKTQTMPTDICNVHAEDLDICDTDKYTYILTYSFPCQDLSLAGLGKGMAKGSGTRSGLLWEVERILRECYKSGSLPQILLMENVPQVIGEKNIKDFADWIKSLEEMGYTNKYDVLNAKNYGIPQNRERCFMVSWLGDYYFEFPEEIELTTRLTEQHGWLNGKMVNEKYFLTDKMIKYILNNDCGTFWNEQARFNPSIARTLSVRTGGGSQRVSFENYIAYGFPDDCPADVVKKAYEEGEKMRIRKLTPKECWRLMGQNDEDFEKAKKVNSDSQLYKQAGNSIVVSVLEAIFGQMFEGKEDEYKKGMNYARKD